jgi:GT2 family glycosyltransferase
VEQLQAALKESHPLVSILVVTHNSAEFLAPLLDSVFRNTAYPRFEIIVVDNASTDASVDVLKSYTGPHEELRVISSQTNLGFAAGNNLAARAAGGDYLVFLNADTMVTWGWLERLLRVLRSGANIGLAAPVTNYSGNETRVDSPYSDAGEMEHFASERSATEFGKVLDLPMVPLLCAILRRDTWVRVGELDESFGIGMFEDDDFCERVREAGYRIVAVEDCFIHHFGGGSFSKIPASQALELFESNKSYFERKWERKWVPHVTRPGVRPLTEADRSSPAKFTKRTARTARPAVEMQLLKLHPRELRVGDAANRQPDGSSALVVECWGATPGTVIRVGTQLLPTTFGHAGLLSGQLPVDFSRVPSSFPVTLVHGFGESNTLTLTVHP